MSKFDGLKDSQSATAEQKLAIIGHEFVREIAVVNGFATILKDSIKEAVVVNCISEECNDWINRVIEASDDMKEILNIMTSNPK